MTRPSVNESNTTQFQPPHSKHSPMLHKRVRPISKISSPVLVLAVLATTIFCLSALVLHQAASSARPKDELGLLDDRNHLLKKKSSSQKSIENVSKESDGSIKTAKSKTVDGNHLQKKKPTSQKSIENVSKESDGSIRKTAKRTTACAPIAQSGSIPDRPDEMPSVGDKSMAYRRLRMEFDACFPEEPWDASWTPEAEADTEAHRRRLELMKELRKRDYEPVHFDNDADCPPTPSPDYPKTFRMKKIITNWNPDDTEPRKKIYQGICRFDYVKDHHKILAYRKAEKPFVIRDDPRVLRTVERWNDPTYLHRLLGDTDYRTEYSLNNHFMYWNMGRKEKPKDWKPPTDMIKMSYPDWFEKANVTDDKLGRDNPHWYFRLIGSGRNSGRNNRHKNKESSENLFDELPFFQPKKSVYMVNPTEQRGIHCRFGMRGVIAENHYDGSRNMVALLGGERRYILAHPDQCTPLYLLPKSHPSGRHSAVDWSNPDWEEFPDFAEAKANEIVMQAGDVLYLPTFWFHYIISLEINFQCNTRSGIEYGYKKDIDRCEPYEVPS